MGSYYTELQPHIYGAIDTIGLQLKNLFSEEQVETIIQFLKKNDKSVILGLGTVTMVFLINKLFGGSSSSIHGIGGSGSSGSRNTVKKNKSKKVKKAKKPELKPEPEPVVVIDPIVASSEKIDAIRKDCDDNYAELVDKLQELVAKRMTQLEEKNNGASKGKGKNKGKGKSKNKKPSDSEEHVKPEGATYKDALKYQNLYLNECLLKLLMALDGIETHGQDELRLKRKETVKHIQHFCQINDELKEKIVNLQGAGIEY